MAWYIDWVKSNMLLSAFVQFALLGTLGEILGILVAKRKLSANMVEWLLKALVWGLLGICVKYAFKGFVGFVDALVAQNLLPAIFGKDTSVAILRAFALSFFMNAQFGPLLMFLHRSTDNLITRAKGYTGIEKSLFTLAWFWLPAHTVTFSLPADFQIGVAALLSVALGLIMGFTKRKA
ncbi:MAG: hypothetical protein KKI09_11790 [Spirochaetes bacterium]|nr:hypothetical protein [Spirochaetota bacterium]MBU0956101.1 hypothetical protein [Spirochaetota bacterium]